MEERQNLKTEEIETLVAQSQSGESLAFGRLYDIFADPIYRYVFYRVKSEEAEDLTELIFLKTWENIRQYRSGQHSFSAWIFRIAHNTVVDYYRSNNHIEEDLTESIPDERRLADASDRTHRSLNQNLLSTAMRELKDRYRQILTLKYINDLSNEEIGYIMGKSQTSIRILQFRALKALRRILERMGFSSFDV
ncbi:sigma-70 family RNA polymerase sigma factor [Candidatus Peregrinibacteria bacterium]|nr:sigma-70 family RNA polymerase sigma factor [Candidatus Peregrinibacteria bacterium]